MTNFVMMVGCLVAGVYLLGRAPKLSGWVLVAAGVYAWVWYGSIL